MRKRVNVHNFILYNPVSDWKVKEAFPDIGMLHSRDSSSITDQPTTSTDQSLNLPLH